MAKQEKIKLHLGCGSVAPKDWLNIDVSFRVWLDRIPLLSAFGYKRRFKPWVRRWNLAKGIPLPNDSVSLIYTSHMIEHLPMEAANRLLRECGRVLNTGGRIRIVTPDLSAMVGDYMARHQDTSMKKDAADQFSSWLGVFGEQGWSRKNLHQWLYDFENLAFRLANLGFREITGGRGVSSDFPDLDVLETEKARAGAVCIEAVK